MVTSGFDLDSFVADERTYDAVLRNLEVIGEPASKELKVVHGSAIDTHRRQD